jgi:hypothetical protein
MFHPNTQRLIDDWTRRKGDRPAPLRAEFSPAGLGALMPQLFMLDGVDQPGAFRLVGGLVADLHGRDLRGSLFPALWQTDAIKVAHALSQAGHAREPVVLSARAHTAEGHETRLEITLAVLAGPDGAVERVLGMYQPTSSLARLLGKPIERLSFRALQLASQGEAMASQAHTTPARSPRTDLKLVVLDGRRVA